MAAPAAVLAVKAALVATTDQRARTAVLSVVAAVLTPFILIIVVLLCTLSGTANHNNAAVDLTFHGGYLSSEMPAEYRMYIEKMRESFADLDEVLTEINGMCEDGTVDDYRVKAIFYALFFGADQPGMNDEDYRTFADCFVTYEERQDEDGNTYTVAVPITNLETIYSNLESVLNRVITPEDKSNAQRIYTQAKYGSAGGGEGGNGLPPGIAMGDGSFKWRKPQSISDGRMCGAAVPQVPALTAAAMCVGYILSPVFITSPARQLRESLISVLLFPVRKPSPVT